MAIMATRIFSSFYFVTLSSTCIVAAAEAFFSFSTEPFAILFLGACQQHHEEVSNADI
jgi:hypothetical protein